jgi:hypothetical protein
MHISQRKNRSKRRAIIAALEENGMKQKFPFDTGMRIITFAARKS